jgi:hypothetical protein
MKKIIITFLILLPILTACDDLFKPAIENNPGIDAMYSDPNYAQGVLGNGYTRIPVGGWSFNDVSTDDAVTNDKTNSYMKMATGQWTSNNNPMDRWAGCRSAIQYLNLFLAGSDKVHWADTLSINTMINDRMKGEAYGLRAMYMYYLLQSHGGVGTDGNLLGIPIVLEPEDNTSNFNQPRATFDDCINQVYADVQQAEQLLPIDFGNITSNAAIPAKYQSMNVSQGDYNRVFGDQLRLRMTARIAKAIRAQAALLAASPAFAAGTSTTWTNTADYAAQVVDLIGGVKGLASKGYTWYANASEIDGITNGVNPPEILWRGSVSTDATLETNNYPPSLFGKGQVNPSQNLVDAFPMANGYPITDANSGYDPQNPYTGRDPRLTTYVVVNGSQAGPSNSVITTAVDGTTNDALGKVETSTRTGYYMRKLLRQDVNVNPSSSNTQKHYKPYIRNTEIFLIYAEAANEAYGPTGTGSHSYSAYDVIKAIRQRAGVGTSNGDPYLESIKSNQDAMRTLIRNERRLELCFEGFRFWDLRRWKAPITDAANGVSISNGTYTDISVENRVYQDYMYYGPIPYGEVLKYNALIQNKGW